MEKPPIQGVRHEEASEEISPERIEVSKEKFAEEDIIAASEELQALWGATPEEVRQSPDFFDLAEGFKGNIESYIASQREWYKKQGIDQSWGDFQIKEKLQRLRDRAVGALGEDESKRLINEMRERKEGEVRKQSDAAAAEKLQAIRKDLGIEAEKNPENLFDRLKREYGIQDVKSMQQAFAAFEEYRKKEKGQFVVGSNQFYQFLVSGEMSDQIESPAAKAMEAEKDADPKDYEKLLVDFYGSWRTNLLAHREQVLMKRPKLKRVLELMDSLPPPQTAEEIRSLYRKYPELNEVSAISYQEGLGEEGMRNNPFLHFASHRKDGYAYEEPPTQVRLYLNPPKEALPQIAKRFTELADQENVPYYFKMIDFSLQWPTRSDARRLDRMVFYSDKENGAKVAELLRQLSDEHPDWFEGRPLPPLVAEAARGVGAAEEPSDYQNEKFSRPGEQNTSFNMVRAKFLGDVWEGVAKDVLMRNPNLRPRGGRTFQEIFNDTISPADRNYIEQFQRANFDPSKLDAQGQRALEDAMRRFMADTLPNVQADSLLPYVQQEIQKKAKEYGVNPENLAFNA